MRSNHILNRVLILVLIMFNVGCDQVTKTIVRDRISYHENIPVIDNHLTLTKVENYGAFLSSGDSLPYAIKFILLSLMPLLVLAYGFYFLMIKTNLDRLFITGICFVIGGGIGNLYDRIIHGSVTDFLHIDFVIFQTGIFNVADLSIMAGMCLVLIHLYFKKRPQQLQGE
ncbi:signal peptidase II [Pedobacter frigoris]|uniref:signal peptidase II n=1 Tax=Pedobacter frigoris TaxID=2571272 RepID=UPI00292DDEB4|nr:signal peptidase II [Pedobacter frigoris]